MGIGQTVCTDTKLSSVAHIWSHVSCSMDANLVLGWRWTKYQIKLFTTRQLQIWIHAVAGYKKLPACKTAKMLTAFLILRKIITYIFNHVIIEWLIISLLNTVIEKKIKLGKQNVKTDEWLGNLCKAVNTKRVSHTLSRCFLKQNYIH